MGVKQALRPPTTSTTRIARRAAGTASAPRMVPEETPVALSYAGTTHAVMMASPADLEDFAVGFTLTEGIIRHPDEIESIGIEEAGAGIDIQIRLKDAANTRFEARRRRLAGPVGCGLCGIESIDEAMRAVAEVGAGLALTEADVVEAVRLLSRQQPFHAQTGAVHAAGFYAPAGRRFVADDTPTPYPSPQAGEVFANASEPPATFRAAVRGGGPAPKALPGLGDIIAVREDVGRHNALDKLAGALAKAGVDGASGAVIVTSRVSVEMVQKTAAIGAAVIVAVSAPTALAIRTAETAGMTLVALVRGDEFDVFTHPERISTKAAKHVA